MNPYNYPDRFFFTNEEFAVLESNLRTYRNHRFWYVFPTLVAWIVTSILIDFELAYWPVFPSLVVLSGYVCNQLYSLRKFTNKQYQQIVAKLEKRLSVVYFETDEVDLPFITEVLVKQDYRSRKTELTVTLFGGKRIIGNYDPNHHSCVAWSMIYEDTGCGSRRQVVDFSQIGGEYVEKFLQSVLDHVNPKEVVRNNP